MLESGRIYAGESAGLSGRMVFSPTQFFVQRDPSSSESSQGLSHGFFFEGCSKNVCNRLLDEKQIQTSPDP